MPASEVRSVLFVVRGGESFPSSRFRAYQYREPFERRGVRVTYLRSVRWWLPHAHVPFVRTMLHEASQHDAVVYQKSLHPLHIALLSRQHPRVFYDFDDAINLTSIPGLFALTMRAAPRVIAGNRELCEVARRYGQRADIVPTTVIPPSAITAPPPSGDFVLSWVGSACNLPFLTPVRAAIRSLRAEGLPLHLHIITEEPEAARVGDGESVEKWSLENEVAGLHACHVGLMPLHDDAWSRGKCACKALQYLSYGRPVISSAVGINAELFEGRPYALLARDERGWREAIRQFHDARSELPARGMLGRQMVISDFSVDVWAPRLLDVLASPSPAASDCAVRQPGAA